MTIPLKDARAAFAGFGAMTVRQEIIATQMRNVSPAGQAVANQKIDPTPTAINTRTTAVAATCSSIGAERFAISGGRLGFVSAKTSDLVCRKFRKEETSCLTLIKAANSSTLSTAASPPAFGIPAND